MSDDPDVIKRETEAIHVLRTALEALAKTGLPGAADASKNLDRVLDSLTGTIGKSGAAWHNLSKAKDKHTAALKDLNDAIKSGSRYIVEEAEALKKASAELAIASREAKNYEKLQRATNEQAEKAADAWKYNTAKMQEWKGVAGQVTGVIGRQLAMFGAQGVGIKNVIDKLVAYKTATFNLGRTYSVTGRETAAFTKNVEKAGLSVGMSMLKMTQTGKDFAESFFAMPPNPDKLLNLMVAIQEQAGYSEEAAQKMRASVATLSEVDPSGFKVLQGLIEESKRIAEMEDGQDKTNAEAALKRRRDMWAFTARERKASLKDIGEGMKASTALTDKEKEAAKVQLETSKSAAQGENLVIKTAAEMEKFVIAAAQATGAFTGVLGENAKAVAIASGALQLFNLGLESGALNIINKAREMKQLSAATGGLGAAGAGAGLGGKALGMAGKGSMVVTAAIVGWEMGQFIDEFAAKLWGSDKKLSDYVGDFFGNMITPDSGGSDKSGKSTSSNQDISGPLKEKLKQAEKVDKQLADTEADQEANIVEMMSNYEMEAQALKVNLDMYDEINNSLSKRVDLAMEFGIVDAQAIAASMANAENLFAKNKEGYQEQIGLINKQLELLGLDTKIKVSTDMSDKDMADMAKQIGDAAKMAASNGSDEEKAEALRVEDSMLAALNKQAKLRAAMGAAENAMAKSRFAQVDAEVKQMESFSSAYESRLDTEARLMESAQFGMGASIEMMQKKVDLAYKFMQNYEEADKQAEKVALSVEGIGQAQLEGLKNATDAGDAQNYIYKTLNKSGAEAKVLMEYAQKHQQFQDKSMKQQEKIYEITKSMREGYLDVIREMSSGFGEFEKIIGTQESGVTQLMDFTKKITGQDKLNTMALGGMSEEGTDAYKSRSQITGAMTYGGAKFQGKGDEEARSKDIYNWGKTEKEMKEKPGVGEANVTGMENYMGETRENVGDAAYQGPIDAAPIVGEKIGETLLKDKRFAQINTSAMKPETHIVPNAAAVGAEYTQRSTSSTPATNSPNTAPGPMPVHRQSSGDKDRLEKYLKVMSTLSSGDLSKEMKALKDESKNLAKIGHKSSKLEAAIAGLTSIEKKRAEDSAKGSGDDYGGSKTGANSRIREKAIGGDDLIVASNVPLADIDEIRKKTSPAAKNASSSAPSVSDMTAGKKGAAEKVKAEEAAAAHAAAAEKRAALPKKSYKMEDESISGKEIGVDLANRAYEGVETSVLAMGSGAKFLRDKYKAGRDGVANWMYKPSSEDEKDSSIRLAQGAGAKNERKKRDLEAKKQAEAARLKEEEPFRQSLEGLRAVAEQPEREAFEKSLEGLRQQSEKFKAEDAAAKKAQETLPEKGKSKKTSKKRRSGGVANVGETPSLSKEDMDIASQMREKVGLVKAGKGESESEAVKKQMMKEIVKAEGYKTSTEEFDKMMKQVDVASGMSLEDAKAYNKKSAKEGLTGVADLGQGPSMHEKDKKAQEAAALSAEMQPQLEVFSGGSGEGGGGGGSVTVLISLDAGLQGQIKDMQNVTVEIQQAAS